jgi:hypothetical protein
VIWGGMFPTVKRVRGWVGARSGPEGSEGGRSGSSEDGEGVGNGGTMVMRDWRGVSVERDWSSRSSTPCLRRGRSEEVRDGGRATRAVLRKSFETSSMRVGERRAEVRRERREEAVVEFGREEI